MQQWSHRIVILSSNWTILTMQQWSLTVQNCHTPLQLNHFNHAALITQTAELSYSPPTEPFSLCISDHLERRIVIRPSNHWIEPFSLCISDHLDYIIIVIRPSNHRMEPFYPCSNDHLDCRIVTLPSNWTILPMQQWSLRLYNCHTALQSSDGIILTMQQWTLRQQNCHTPLQPNHFTHAAVITQTVELSCCPFQALDGTVFSHGFMNVSITQTAKMSSIPPATGRHWQWTRTAAAPGCPSGSSASPGTFKIKHPFQIL